MAMPMAEVEQQRGQPGADREPDRGHGDQQHERAHRQRRVEVVERELLHQHGHAVRAPSCDKADVARAGAPCAGHPPPRPVTCGVLVSQGAPRENCPPYRCVPDRPRGRRRRRRRGGRGRAASAARSPTTSGSLEVRGLSAPVDVLRDKQGVPQIYADNAQDLFRAQGYVAAQDRFFEMDLRRHITAGRLSEMVGAGGLETDKVIRTMGWRRVAEAELPHPRARRRGSTSRPTPTGSTPTSTRMGTPSKMALEYVVLGQQVPDYRVEHVDAGGLPVLAQGDGLGPARQLRQRAGPRPPRRDDEPRSGSPSSSRPTPTTTHQPILSAQDWKPAARPKAGRRAGGVRHAGLPAVQGRPTRSTRRCSRSLAAVPVMLGRGDGIGSNSWVVAGSRTSTGKPLLANDPHLGTGIPGIWYQTGLHCRTVSSAVPVRRRRATPSPGLPGVVIGHNQSGRLGLHQPRARTSATSSSSRCAANTYLRDGKQVPLASGTETIKVGRRQGRADHGPQTVHGPILSDVVPNVGPGRRHPPVEGKAHGGGYDVSLAVDRAATGAPDGRRDLRPRHGPELPAVPGGGARLRRAGAEPRLRRRRRAHRLPGARADPGPQPLHARRPARLLARAGLEVPRTTGRATSRSPRCPRRTTRRRGSSSRPTRP